MILYTFYSYFLIASADDSVGISLCSFFWVVVLSFCSSSISLIFMISYFSFRFLSSSSCIYLALIHTRSTWYPLKAVIFFEGAAYWSGECPRNRYHFISEACYSSLLTNNYIISHHQGTLLNKTTQYTITISVFPWKNEVNCSYPQRRCISTLDW